MLTFTTALGPIHLDHPSTRQPRPPPHHPYLPYIKTCLPCHPCCTHPDLFYVQFLSLNFLQKLVSSRSGKSPRIKPTDISFVSSIKLLHFYSLEESIQSMCFTDTYIFFNPSWKTPSSLQLFNRSIKHVMIQTPLSLMTFMTNIHYHYFSVSRRIRSPSVASRNR